MSTTSKQNGREQAFPLTFTTGSVQRGFTVTERKGMTKRETIAMHLMAGLLTNDNLVGSSTLQENHLRNWATYAVNAADALLEALE